MEKSPSQIPSGSQDPSRWWWEISRQLSPRPGVLEEWETHVRAFWWTSGADAGAYRCVFSRSAEGVKGRVFELSRELGESRGSGSQGTHDVLFSFVVPRDQPLELVPVTVPKPWGREIWHSGVERRGVSRVALRDLNAGPVEVPLPFVELALGFAKADHQSACVLLKELDPFDIPFYGELYTEIHKEKSEIYVVSGLGSQCCPEGRGFVKLGLAPEVLGDTSREKVRAALGAFETIRKEVDRQLLAGGFDFGAQVAAGEQGPRRVQEAKERLVESELLEQERQAYAAASACFQMHPLSLGDIVRVPRHVPHALQPGVRVIEFQTPHYERLILSSNQKVMTQATWDVAEGVDSFLPVSDAELQSAITRSRELTTEQVSRVVAFEGLDVLSVSLLPEQTCTLSGELASSVLVLQVLGGGCETPRGPHAWALEAGRSYLWVGAAMELRAAPGAGAQTKVLVASSAPLHSKPLA